MPVALPTRSHNARSTPLIALIADVGGYSAAEVARSSRLDADLGYDSLLQVRLLSRLRSEYPELEHISVSDVLPHIHTVGALVDFVAARVDNVGEGSML